MKERELEDLKKLEEETVERIEREKVHFIGASEEVSDEEGRVTLNETDSNTLSLRSS